jgi:hypothetical protein
VQRIHLPHTHKQRIQLNNGPYLALFNWWTTGLISLSSVPFRVYATTRLTKEGSMRWGIRIGCTRCVLTFSIYEYWIVLPFRSLILIVYEFRRSPIEGRPQPTRPMSLNWSDWSIDMTGLTYGSRLVVLLFITAYSGCHPSGLNVAEHNTLGRLD